MKYTIAITAILAVSCQGAVDETGTVMDPDNSGVTQPGNGTVTDPNAPVSTTEPFRLTTATPQLLPFDTRVRRVANAVGVSVDHPMFADMYANNIRLGDYDHANGVLPDGLWIASRIAGWIDALRPICTSAEMAAAYPALPDALPTLIRNAWGRAATPEDLAAFSDPAAASAITPELKYESMCLSVFTAAEFVFR